MKKVISMTAVFIALIFIMPISVYANSAEPPKFTIVSDNVPEDVEIYVTSTWEDKTETRVTSKSEIAWEIYFRSYSISADDTYIIDVKSSEKISSSI